MRAVARHPVVIALALSTLAAKPATVPSVVLKTDADADRYFAGLPESARREFVDSEKRRRTRIEQQTTKREALRKELATYLPGGPEKINGRTRAQVAREMEVLREELVDLSAREDFYAPEFTSPVRPGQIGSFANPVTVRRVIGPRNLIIDANDSAGKTDTLLLTGEPTAKLTPGQHLILHGVYRVTSSTTPKGQTISRAQHATDLEDAPELLLQAVSRALDHDRKLR